MTPEWFDELLEDDDPPRVIPELVALFTEHPIPDSRDEHYRLALESCARWLNRYRMSPAMRLRALRSVVQSALSDAED